MCKVKYTFLVPSYKASFLEEALLSIKNQTFKDFKVLISDDCSPEPLKPIYDKVCGGDSRFTFRRNKENMGGKSLVSHWNLLVDMCDTEYLIMASDDDVYEPNFLEKIDDLVIKYPQVDILRARARRVEDGMIMAQNGIASTHEILFSFRISNENLSSTSGYTNNIINVATANLLFVDWYSSNISPLLDELPVDQKFLKPLVEKAHKCHVENILQFLLAQMKLNDLIRFLKAFHQRGYLKGSIANMQVWKNWVKKRL